MLGRAWNGHEEGGAAGQVYRGDAMHGLREEDGGGALRLVGGENVFRRLQQEL